MNKLLRHWVAWQACQALALWQLWNLHRVTGNLFTKNGCREWGAATLQLAGNLSSLSKTKTTGSTAACLWSLSYLCSLWSGPTCLCADAGLTPFKHFGLPKFVANPGAEMSEVISHSMAKASISEFVAQGTARSSLNLNDFLGLNGRASSGFSSGWAEYHPVSSTA